MGILEFLKAILFGIVEGITEWLPVSSTGHLIILNQIVPLNMSEAFVSMFTVVIQLGAILAVVLMFWNKIWPFDFKSREVIKKDTFIMWFKIVVATIPAGIVGVLFDDKCEELFYNPVAVSIALIVFGVLFIVVETQHKGVAPKVRSISQITYKMAFIIGLWQMLAAIFPGTSRSGATIIGALLLGLSRTVAAEFTFFLAIPAMFGASVLKLWKLGFAMTGFEFFILLVGMIVSFLVSVFVIKFLMSYIKKHDFKAFGWYRIGLAIVVLLYFAITSLL